MTVSLSGKDVAAKINQVVPGAVVESTKTDVVVKSELLFPVAEYLQKEPGFNFNYLAALTVVDYIDYFEMVYQLTSIDKNHNVVLKTRLYGRNEPEVASVVPLWRGAEFQEREAYDLFGIIFKGHPNLKRIVLWDGFPGHPLRKDYL